MIAKIRQARACGGALKPRGFPQRFGLNLAEGSGEPPEPPYIEDMNAIALRPPLLIVRWLVRVGLLPALVFALSADVWQFEASRDCRGSFSAGFGTGFDPHRCDLVVRKIGADVEIRVPLPQ